MTLREIKTQWEQADHAWQVSLEKHFGKQASERRYDADKTKHPTECHEKWSKVRYWRSVYVTKYNNGISD